MKNDTTIPLAKAVRMNEGTIRRHVNQFGRGRVEETLNAFLGEKAGRHLVTRKNFLGSRWEQ